MFSQKHVVVGQKDHRRARIAAANETRPFLDQRLTGQVGRVRLARENELRRALGILENPEEPLGIVQQEVGPFVSRKAARKPEGKHPGIQPGLGPRNGLGSCSAHGHVPADAFAGIFHQGFSTDGTQRPELFVRNLPKVRCQSGRRSEPTILATSLRPKIVCRRRIPGRHVHTVGHVTDRHFTLRPPGEER